MLLKVFLSVSMLVSRKVVLPARDRPEESSCYSRGQILHITSMCDLHLAVLAGSLTCQHFTQL